MADKSTALIQAALSRAMADPGGVPLHGRKADDGLFASSAGGRLAAQRCKDDGFLQLFRTEVIGKKPREIYGITEKGVAYLLAQVGPKQVLEDFVRVLESRQTQAGEVLGQVQQMRALHQGLAGR